MEIRQWFLGQEGNDPSNVDLVVNEILNHFKVIFDKFTESSPLNVNDFADKINSDNYLHSGFKMWFNEEGKTFLVELSNKQSLSNQVLLEELQYVNFIMSSEASGILDSLDDTIGIMVDISDKLKELLF